MALLHRLLILTLLGAARAPPPGSSDDSGDACAADGSSATYAETISRTLTPLLVLIVSV